MATGLDRREAPANQSDVLGADELVPSIAAFKQHQPSSATQIDVMGVRPATLLSAASAAPHWAGHGPAADAGTAAATTTADVGAGAGRSRSGAPREAP